jgi:tRNA(Ile)-lysidine synthase
MTFKASHHLTQILTSFLEKHDLNTQESIAVAVSGGPDSLALMALMAEHTQSKNIELHILSVDHGLRTSAKDEVQMVAEWVCSQKSAHIQHKILTWEGEKPEAAIMENARAARYDLMAEYCAAHKIQTLLVAHHQDDQAETFLIRLAKGSGLNGLGAMQEVRDYKGALKIARPLLSVSKEELIALCEEEEIPYVRDPSNENDDYLRPRLRKSMDVLAKEGLTAKRLSLTAKRLSRARRALDDIADSAFQACLIEKRAEAYVFNFNALKGCPEEISLRVIQRAVEAFREGADYNVRMERLENVFESLWDSPENFKSRTLGGCKFSLKKEALLTLTIEKEKI